MRTITICLFILLTLSSFAHASSSDPRTWDEKRWGEVTEQGLDNSCGLAALLTIMQYHFGDTRFDERALLGEYMKLATAEEIAESLQTGISLLGDERLAQSVGYKTAKKVLSFDDLETVVVDMKLPVLVYLEIGDLKHFAVVTGIENGFVSLADSSRGNIEQSVREFMSEWKAPKGFSSGTGAVLILIHNDDLKEYESKLLKNPRPEPPSFKEMRRQTTVGRL